MFSDAFKTLLKTASWKESTSATHEFVWEATYHTHFYRILLLHFHLKLSFFDRILPPGLPSVLGRDCATTCNRFTAAAAGHREARREEDDCFCNTKPGWAGV